MENIMARPKKIIEAVEETVADFEKKEEVVKEVIQNTKVVAMVRSEEYPEPRNANVHPSEVEEWKKHGWTEK
jgi:hypothetical protein